MVYNREWAQRYYLKNKDRLDKQHRDYWLRTGDERRGYQKNRWRKKRTSVIQYLGGACVVCGFADSRALQLNHINGGGSKETANGSYKLLNEVLFGKRKDIELRCANCNCLYDYEIGTRGA